MIEVFIRQPQSPEIRSVRAGVQTVVNEVYGGVSAPRFLPVNEKAGTPWVPVVAEKIVGVVLTRAEWQDDLWVLRDTRGWGR